MVDGKRVRVTMRNNRIVIILFHVLIAIKVTSRFTSLNLPGWDLAVSWTTILIPIGAVLTTIWLAYYYLYLSGEKVG